MFLASMFEISGKTDTDEVIKLCYEENFYKDKNSDEIIYSCNFKIQLLLKEIKISLLKKGQGSDS